MKMGCSDSTPQANNPKRNGNLLSQNKEWSVRQGSTNKQNGLQSSSVYSHDDNGSYNHQTIRGHWQANYNEENDDNAERVHIIGANEPVTFLHNNTDSPRFSSIRNQGFRRPSLNQYDLNNANEEYSFRQNLIRNNYNQVRAIRPVFRRHSLNDDYSRPQQSLTRFRGYPVRRRSLNDYDRDVFRGTDTRSSSGNYSSDETIFHYNIPLVGEGQQSYQDSSTSWNSANNVRGVRCGGLKRNSWDDDDDDVEAETSNYNSDALSQRRSRPDLSDLSYVGPRVKRRASNGEGVYAPASEDYVENHDDESASENVDVSDNEVTNDLTNHSINSEPFASFHHMGSQLNVLDILSFPSEWSSCTIDKTGFVDISYSSPEGRSVERFFHRTSNAKEFKLHITGITRVENPFLHSLYLLKKEEMASRNGHVDEIFLYHGTRKECLSDILENNLNWRLFSEKHRFGQGVSFSPSASYSSHYSDKTVVKVMLLFKVLVSNVYVGSPEMNVPPINYGVTYDTSIKEDTTVIVKYCDNEFYPLYKIMYTKRLT